MTAALLDMARGACPALDAPMQTGDGLLSRIALMDWISPTSLGQICHLAQLHGNGVIDISQRGNLQVRGLTAASTSALEAGIRSLNLPLREGLAVEWTPLAGMEPDAACDPRPLGLAIIDHARGLRGRLAPKLSVVLDVGGVVRFDHLLADIRLTAQPEAEGLRWTVMLGGTAQNGLLLGSVADADICHLVCLLLDHLAEQGPKARGRSLTRHNLPDQILRFVLPDVAEARPCWSDQSNPLSLPHDKGIVCLGLPFGQMKAELMLELCQHAQAFGIERLKPSPNHALLLVGQPAACMSLLREAQQIGFTTEANDPLSAIDACAGRPACRSAHLATHELGRFAASQTPELFDGTLRLHLSGCAKGCAHPTASMLTFVGTETGSRLVFCGKTTDTALKQLAPHTEKAAIVALSALIGAERRSGETNHDCLTRLGPEKIAAALDEGH
ncbi:precorrin-3B synthase [Rhizobium helianthi]|uniref:Precorrin-3B synthase n=1 Tax=Rhizobium helianthi TaxID=1132695 RepID=A0ABW4M458_9HYPH